MPIPDLTARAAFLTRIIAAAGSIARSEFENHIPGQFDLKGPQDPVTLSDHKVETFLRNAIADAFPNDSFFGEETGLHGADGDCGIWVVDPIDGTDNFARGIPHFCVSIAFVHDHKTRLGAIYLPMTEDTFFAQAGQGARLNGAAIHVSDIKFADLAAIELGWSPRIKRNDYMGVLTALLDQGSNVRRSGSGALALTQVAHGRSDGYVELEMNSWDSLAGLLLVREAGGITCPDPAARALHIAGLVYATNKYLGDEIGTICRPAEPA